MSATGKLQAYNQTWAKAQQVPVKSTHKVLWFLNPKTGKTIHEIKTVSHIAQAMYTSKKGD